MRPRALRITHHLAACVLGLLVSFVQACPVAAQTTQSVDALKRWIEAVREHQPGRADRAALDVAALSFSKRLELNPAMEVFLSAMRGQTIGTRTEARRQIGELFLSVRDDPGLAKFIRLAAFLHTDAGVFASNLPPAPDDLPAAREPTVMIDGRSGLAMAQPRLLPPPQAPPLLTRDRFVLHSDGRMIGVTGANWNWPFARSLVDLLLPPSDRRKRGLIGTAADLEFVGGWYHAVSSYLMASADLGDLRGHLEQGAVALPKDARLAFDAGCYAETLGLAYNQVLRDDTGFSRAAGQLRIEVAFQRETNSKAEELFRRAIEIDAAGSAEARVRLARLLEHRGRQEEAADEIRSALAERPERTVAYYAHLIGGRVSTAMSRHAEALMHYEAALTLYPDAQSARLGTSQAALMTGDVRAAQAALAQLHTPGAAASVDPWWKYAFGSGRDVDALMAELWIHAK